MPMSEQDNIEYYDIDESVPEVPAPVEEPIAVVEESTPEPAVEVEEVIAEEPAVAAEIPEAEPVKAREEKVAVSGEDVDNVLLASCIYKNMYSRKSLTVHHLQRRLLELGYKEADTDKDGWLGDETLAAIKQFQRDKGLPDSGNSIDADTFNKIFQGDPHVRVVL